MLRRQNAYYGSYSITHIIRKAYCVSSMEKTIGFESGWYRLDNAAKLFPAIINPKDSCVFRVSVRLSQNVDHAYLQQAAFDLKPRFPSLYVKLRSGVFWNYYERNEKAPVVRPESPYVNKHIDLHENNGYHFALFYAQNRIHLEVFHGLCDGGAALEFLKALVLRYFELQGCAVVNDGSVLSLSDPPRNIEVEDSFIDNYEPTGCKRETVENAYRLQGTRFKAGGLGVIKGRFKANQFIALSKKHGVTPTQYLAALLTYCIWQSDESAQTTTDPINICVSVNMRKYFHSLTLRNFSLYFHSSTKCAGSDTCFESILHQVKDNFDQELTKEKLQQKLNANVAVEKNMLFRICPLIIKNAAIRIACLLIGDNCSTCGIANLGRITMPESISSYIKDFDCTSGVGNDATHAMNAISYNDTMVISFSRTIYETKIEKLFFKYLADQGVNIEIESNFWELFSQGGRHAQMS